jgi:hypothetical protein
MQVYIITIHVYIITIHVYITIIYIYRNYDSEYIYRQHIIADTLLLLHYYKNRLIHITAVV